MGADPTALWCPTEPDVAASCIQAPNQPEINAAMSLLWPRLSATNNYYLWLLKPSEFSFVMVSPRELGIKWQKESRGCVCNCFPNSPIWPTSFAPGPTPACLHQALCRSCVPSAPRHVMQRCRRGAGAACPLRAAASRLNNPWRAALLALALTLACTPQHASAQGAMQRGHAGVSRIILSPCSNHLTPGHHTWAARSARSVNMQSGPLS